MKFPQVPLAEIPLEIVDGDRGANYPKAAEFSQSGHCLFLNAGNVSASGFNFTDTSFISSTKDQLLRKGKLIRNDVILTTRGTVGNLALYDDSVPYLDVRINSGMVILRPDRTALDPEFLYYALRSPAFSEQVTSLQTGSAQPQLPIRDIKHLSIPFPSLVQQKKLSQRLKLIFDKIELNRKMNETLEEIALTLFQDWFVDFGPTRRQMEGATDPVAIMGKAFPAEKAGTLAPLFASTLGDDGLPKGWTENPFENFVEIVGGGTPKTKVAEYWGDEIPWYSVVDAPTKGAVYVHSTEKSITKNGLENSSARLVPEGTTIISARGTVGKIGMASREMTFNQSCYALRPKRPVGECFVFLATGQMVERLKAMAHGSVFSTITRNTFTNLSFAGAKDDCYSAFEEIVAPLFTKIKANGQENQTLAEIRNLLLPKLMSGEIRLKDKTVYL